MNTKIDVVGPVIMYNPAEVIGLEETPIIFSEGKAFLIPDRELPAA